MTELSLKSLNDSVELLNNETIDSYSLLFDKDKHNFSTSSETSFIKQQLSPIDHNQTLTKQILIEESENFNPFSLLFIQNNEQQTNDMQTNIISYNEKIRQSTSSRQESLNIKTPIRNQQNESKR